MRKQKIGIEDLRALNEKLKTMPKERTVVYVTLLAMQEKMLDAGLQCYRHYLLGKYWEFMWKQSLDICHLEQANSHYDAIFEVEKQYPITIKNGKYFFKRAYCKYLLSQEVESEDDRDGLIIVSAIILRNGLKIHPTNSSMLWLQKLLQKS